MYAEIIDVWENLSFVSSEECEKDYVLLSILLPYVHLYFFCFQLVFNRTVTLKEDAGKNWYGWY
jgi:hypothetical protein